MIKTRFASLMIVMGLASFLVGCNTWVEPGYVGIKVTATGSQRGVNDYPLQTGRVWYNPYNENVLVFPTFTKNVVWTHNVNEGKPINEEITFTNKDKFPIAVDVNLSYNVVREKVPSFYVKFRTDNLDDFTHGYMHNVARDAFNEVGGHYGIDEIMGDNGKFLAEVKSHLADHLAPLGVEIGQFGIIGAPRPPADVAAAITASARATQLATQIQNELAQTTAEAMKQVAQAEGAAKARLAEAEAEASSNRKIAESISPTLVEYMKVQKWDGKLPTVSGGGTPLINIGAR
jgi:regulator of protease activity HflC (stomatin/prohibitin superfamily)